MITGEEYKNLEAERDKLRAELDALRERVYTNTQREMVMDHRFFVAYEGSFICDENFDFDAGLKVSGDFCDVALKEQYAQMVACTLNNAVKAIAERDALAAQLKDANEQLFLKDKKIDHITKAGEESDAANDALAARVAEMRKALDDFPGLDCDTEDVLRWMRIKRKALATPDDSAAILARRDADTLEMAKRRWYSGEFNFLCAEDAMQRMADEFRVRAAELGKAHG